MIDAAWNEALGSSANVAYSIDPERFNKEVLGINLKEAPTVLQDIKLNAEVAKGPSKRIWVPLPIVGRKLFPFLYTINALCAFGGPAK